jgi:hypothetical protein
LREAGRCVGGCGITIKCLPKKIDRFIKPIPIEAIGGMAATQN